MKRLLHFLLGIHDWSEGKYMKECRFCPAYRWYE